MNGRSFARTLATNEHLLKRYWDSGYALIDELYAPLLDVIRTSPGFTDIRHLHFPENERRSSSQGLTALLEPWIDSRTMTLDEFRAYVKTWSSYKSWKDEHPHDADIVDGFFDKQQSMLGISGGSEVEIEWPHFAIIARKPL
ncbi:hypothetical protein GGF42_007314 [Coemansia sp. RSA 2424]|nr:hypothetical protein GGF42_007314 [Coemansia sp. RSA 2424]